MQYADTDYEPTRKVWKTVCHETTPKPKALSTTDIQSRNNQGS